MSSTSGRTAWIDLLKGIAIMFVVLGHNPLTTTYPKIFNVIFSFHIPLFFFISGYLFNLDLAGRDICKKRFNSLIKPYIFTVGFISLIYILVKSRPSLLWYILWGVYGNGPNLPKTVLHLWFLPNLFLVTLLTWLLFRYVRLIKTFIVFQFLLIAAFLVLGFLGIHLFWNLKMPLFITNFFMADGNQFLVNGLLNNPAYSQEQLIGGKQYIIKGLPWSIDVILITAAFFISGCFIRKGNLEFIFYKHGIALLMISVFTVLHFFYNHTIDLNLRRYDNIVICTLLAYAGIHISTYTANIIAKKKNRFISSIQYLGKYSLIIFIFHPIVQSSVYYTIISLLPSSAHSIAILTAFAAGVLTPLLLNWAFIERFKVFRYWYFA